MRNCLADAASLQPRAGHAQGRCNLLGDLRILVRHAGLLSQVMEASPVCVFGRMEEPLKS
jgi:hypothetical protein